MSYRSNRDRTHQPIQSTVQQGWECPRCGKIHAPWMPTCSCTRPVAFSIGGNSPPGRHSP